MLLAHSSFFVALQVYRARLATTGEEVAVKVQRPAALSIISKVCAGQASASVHGTIMLPFIMFTRLERCIDMREIALQDLYVMRRAVVLYERLIRRFTAQTTDYQILLSTFAGAHPSLSKH